MAPLLAPTVKLNNGSDMPIIGLSTSHAGYDKVNVHEAIDAGYRLIDTYYNNESEPVVAKAVRDKIDAGVIKRGDIFIIAKLWCHAHEPERVEYACRKSLERLGLDYIDCFLLYWPFSFVYTGDDVFLPVNAIGDVEFNDVDYVDTWKAMEALVEKGLVKSIGVSNFNSEQLLRLLANCKIKPVLNQVECHLGLSQKPLIALCKEHDIVVTAYRTLTMPDGEMATFFLQCHLKTIGNKYKKSPSQVILRYLIELGAVPLLSLVSNDRVLEYLNVSDFMLSPEDCQMLDSVNTGKRMVLMEFAVNNKYYPFNIQY